MYCLRVQFLCLLKFFTHWLTVFYYIYWHILWMRNEHFGSFQAVAKLQTQEQKSTLLQSPSRSQRQRMATPDSASRRRLLSPEHDLEWDMLREDLPTGPLIDLEEDSRIYKLAREVSRLGKLMSAGRDLHDPSFSLLLARTSAGYQSLYSASA
jgi:hypothetical protein